MARPAVKALAAAMSQMAVDEAAAAAAVLAAEDAMHAPFVTQSAEAKELYVESSIPRIAPPTALEFYRDWVARNKPVIITNALTAWPAMQRWPLKGYLRSKLAGTDVTIDRVPVDDRSRMTTDGVGEGFGDSVVRGSYFVTPSEERMRFGEFLDSVEGKRGQTDGVLYCQHQNNSLVDEFAAVRADVAELPWASEAFGSLPDATNLWIGTDRSVSTLHHDPYENMYAVIAGSKQFLLYPPSDFHWLDKREYPKCRWQYEPPNAADAAAAVATAALIAAPSDSASSIPSTLPRGKFTLIPDPDGARTAWFDLEPQGAQGCLDPDHGSAGSGLAFDYSALPPLELSKESALKSLPAPGPFPPYSTHPRMSDSLRRRHASPIWVDLQAGEVLYLPSLWFHRVAQRGAGSSSKDDNDVADAAASVEAASASASASSPSSPSPSAFSKLTIAVNFWYDMSFDSRYTAFKFQEAVSNRTREEISQKMRTQRDQVGQEKSVVKPKATAAAAPAAASPSKSPVASSSSNSKPAAAASVKPAAASTKVSPVASLADSTAASLLTSPLAPPILLLTLCGLPAAGKSSLCRALSMHAADALEQQGLPASCETHYISFDDVYERLLKRSQKGATAAAAAAPVVFSPALWKQSRLVALQWAESIMAAARSYAASSSSASASVPHLLLLDDNFYLRSMRRRAFQLARRHSAGYMQLHVACDVDEAVRRNAERNHNQQQEQRPQVSNEDEQLLIRIIKALPSASAPAASASASSSSMADSADDSAEFDAASLLCVIESSRVSEATIRKMAAAFQPPPVAVSSGASSAVSSPSSSAGWERDSVRFESGDLRSLMETLTRMAAAFRAPWSPVADAAAEADRLSAARAQSESSFWHQLDLSTRKVVGQKIAERTAAAVAAGSDAAAVQDAAKRWNAQRKHFLSERKQKVASPPDLGEAALAQMVAQFEATLAN